MSRKLAVITWRNDDKSALKLAMKALGASFEISEADNLNEFLRLHDPLTQYDGLLSHPRVHERRQLHTYLRQECEGMKHAHLTGDPEHYEDLKDFDALAPSDIDRITRYFYGNQEEE